MSVVELSKGEYADLVTSLIKQVRDLKKERDELKAKFNEINCFHYNIKIGKYANMKRSKIIEQLGKLVFEKREVST